MLVFLLSSCGGGGGGGSSTPIPPQSSSTGQIHLLRHLVQQQQVLTIQIFLHQDQLT